MSRSHQQFILDVEARNEKAPGFHISIVEGSIYAGLDKDIHMHCLNGHDDFITKPRHIIQKGSGCPACKSAKQSVNLRKGMEQLVVELETINSNVHIVPGQTYTTSNAKLSFTCNLGHKFSTMPKALLSGHGCPKCANIKRRKTTIKRVVYQQDRCSDIQADVDMITPTNVIVEVIPITTTFSKYQTRERMELLQDSGKHVIMLFEDEWINNQELIARKIVHYAKKSDAISVHARKCVIKEIANNDNAKQLLLNTNHVQGNDKARKCYGAYYNDILVAVMTFAVPRVALGQKSVVGYKEHGWELSRFCTDVNYRIPGIASRLLAAFKKETEWKEIYSYADKRWGTGNMYYQLGFKLVADNPPAYFYVVNDKRKHRWSYRKDVIKNSLANYDATLTEHENMANHGYHWVWDCGTLKFSVVNDNHA